MIPLQLLQLVGLTLHEASDLHAWYPESTPAQQTVPLMDELGVGANVTCGAEVVTFVTLEAGWLEGAAVMLWVVDSNSATVPLPVSEEVDGAFVGKVFG